MRTIAQKREREAGNCPEQGKFVAPALAAEIPTVRSMAQVGSKKKVHSEK
jgi:hypothetical protein